MRSWEAEERERCALEYMRRSHQAMLDRNAAEAEFQRRSAAETATAVADLMVSRAAADFPDVFAARNLTPLRSLIAAWIVRGE